jgi:hypothetical protein
VKTSVTTMTDAAASVGLIAISTSSHIRFGNVIFSPPLMEITTVSSPNEETNAKSNAAMQRPLTSGIVMCRGTRSRLGAQRGGGPIEPPVVPLRHRHRHLERDLRRDHGMADHQPQDCRHQAQPSEQIELSYRNDDRRDDDRTEKQGEHLTPPTRTKPRDTDRGDPCCSAVRMSVRRPGRRLRSEPTVRVGRMHQSIAMRWREQTQVDHKGLGFNRDL